MILDDPTDPGHAWIVESESIERAVLCAARLIDLRPATGEAYGRICIRTVDETAPVCPDHGARRPPR